MVVWPTNYFVHTDPQTATVTRRVQVDRGGGAKGPATPTAIGTPTVSFQLASGSNVHRPEGSSRTLSLVGMTEDTTEYIAGDRVSCSWNGVVTVLELKRVEQFSGHQEWLCETQLKKALEA